MSYFTFHCPNCNMEIQADTEWIGQLADCPRCKKVITIPNINSEKNNYVQNPVQETINQSNFRSDTPVDEKIICENNLVDNKEDNFVLTYLLHLQQFNKVLFILISIILVIAGIVLMFEVDIDYEESPPIDIDFDNKCAWWGIMCILGIIPLYIDYLLNKVLLSWLRGVYRNLLRINK